MTQNPIYDYPNPHTSPQQEVQTSPRNISLMGRLRFTQPIWLQIDINSATALHILHREPPGTFLVRRSNMRQCMVLCLRLPDNSSSGFVTTYCLHREPTVISLEGSDMKFPSLLHLVASYCSTPDILPLPLRLPHAIRKASSNHQLEAIAHLELEFWSSSFNTREPVQPAPLVPPVGVGIDPLLRSLHNPEGENCKQLVSADTTRDSFTGMPLGDVHARRQRFKNSMKVQVSTEAASPLTPPAAPPPPIPVWKNSPPSPPQFPVSCGGNWSSSCHSSFPVPLKATVTSEAYDGPSGAPQYPVSVHVSSEATATSEAYSVPFSAPQFPVSVQVSSQATMTAEAYDVPFGAPQFPVSVQVSSQATVTSETYNVPFGAPQFPASCGGNWSSSSHPSPHISLQATVESETYNVPFSDCGTREREDMHHFLRPPSV